MLDILIDRRIKMVKVYRTKRMLFLSGRPERDTCINNEDIINLKIALATAQSLEAFLLLV